MNNCRFVARNRGRGNVGRVGRVAQRLRGLGLGDFIPQTDENPGQSLQDRASDSWNGSELSHGHCPDFVYGRYICQRRSKL